LYRINPIMLWKQYLIFDIHDGRFINLQNRILFLCLTFLVWGWHKHVLVVLPIVHHHLGVISAIPSRLVHIWLLLMDIRGLIAVEEVGTDLLARIQKSLWTKNRMGDSQLFLFLVT